MLAVACPEEIGVSGGGGVGGEGRWWLVWAPLISDIWSWAAYLGQRSGLPSPSPARHLGSSGETETTWWVSSSIITQISSPLQHQQPQSPSFREALIMILTLSEIFWEHWTLNQLLRWDKESSDHPTVSTEEWREGRVSLWKIKCFLFLRGIGWGYTF